MEDGNIVNCKTKEEFYIWLKENHDKKNECFLECKKGKINSDTNILYYIDAVYMALCFGWIDSTLKIINGKRYQRFGPRKKNSHWSELNKARCKWLIQNKLMTESGSNILPDLEEELMINEDIIKELKKDKETLENFEKFPELYKRVRIGNIQREKKNSETYKIALKHFLEETKKNKMYGDWNDNGRLIDIYN